MQDARAAFPLVYRSLEDVAGSFAVHPLRAEVRLWDILWRLTQIAPEKQIVVPWHVYSSPVVQVRQMIELRLGQPLSVRELAEESGISHNHLTRLFHASVGNTVIGYIQTRRVERARHLLVHTTLPVKTVALQVDVEDVRVFYKLVRARTGYSPTQLRQKINSG